MQRGAGVTEHTRKTLPGTPWKRAELLGVTCPCTHTGAVKVLSLSSCATDAPRATLSCDFVAACAPFPRHLSAAALAAPPESRNMLLFLSFPEIHFTLNVSCRLIRQRQAGRFGPENPTLYSWISCPSMQRSANHKYFLFKLFALLREFGVDRKRTNCDCVCVHISVEMHLTVR